MESEIMRSKETGEGIRERKQVVSLDRHGG